MKLNNLSRLAALLLAVMMLGTSFAWADSSIDLSEFTGTYMDCVAWAAEMEDAGYCTTCLDALARYYIKTWPAEDDKCLYAHLASMTVMERYNLLSDYYAKYQEYWNKYQETQDAEDYTASDYYYGLYMGYWNAAYGHSDSDSTTYPHLICKQGCTVYSQSALVAPGTAHSDTCPWYCDPLSSEPDVSTPDALRKAIEEGITKVQLSYPVTGTTYTWQYTSAADPTATDTVWQDAADGTPISTVGVVELTPASLTYAYRCVVTDSTGAQVDVSDPFYIGGETFFAWVNSTDGDTGIRTWMLLDGNTVEYILAAYAASADGIALAEAIYVAAGEVENTYILLELLGLTTLADIDAEGNVIDARYHIVVATYDAETGVLTALAAN